MIDQFYKEFRVKDYLEKGEIKNYKDMIDCSLGTNSFIETCKVEEYIRKSKCVLNEYPVNQYELLKEKLVEVYQKNCCNNINVENITFGSGTMGLLRNLSEFLIHPNTRVLGVAPQFTRFISEVELRHGIYEYYELDKNSNYKFIAEDFMKLISKKYSLIYIDNPNNPTGQIINIKDIEKIVKEASQHEIIVIIDEAYGDYMCFENSAINLVDKYKNIVVLRSASKFYGLPNHRIGYMFANKEIIDIYNQSPIVRPFSDLSANIFVNILDDYKNIKKIKEKVVEVNKKIYKKIDENNYIYTSLNTPIFTIKTEKKINLAKELLNNGIISEGGEHFLNLNEKYARIRINERSEEVVNIINKII